MRALINLKTKSNFINQIWVIQHNLSLFSIWFKMIKILNRHIIHSYNTQSLIMCITDTERFTHEHKIRDQAVHIKNYNLILRFFWLKQINFDIDWWQINWHYCHKVILNENSDIKIINVKTITNKILTETEIYIMIIDKLVKIT